MKTVSISSKYISLLIRILEELGYIIKYLERTPGEEEFNLYFKVEDPSDEVLSKAIRIASSPDEIYLRSNKYIWKIYLSDEGKLKIEKVLEI